MVNRLTAWAGPWLDTFRHPAIRLTNSLAPGVEISPLDGLNSADVARAMAAVDAYSAADMHRTQPNIRSVVDFLARNIAQLGLHAFKADGDDGRERDRTSTVAEVLDDPSLAQTPYELVYSIVADLATFDEAWLLVTRTNRTDSGWEIRPLPVPTVTVVRGSEWAGDLVIEVQLDERSKPIELKYEQLVHLHGWSPGYTAKGTPPMDALKGTLAEQVAAQAYRAASWRNGGQVGSYIHRPKDAHAWSEAAEQRFVESMRAYRGKGALAGGMPLLQDGMEIKQVRLSAKEEQWIEAAQLSLETVCRVYQVNPSMLGSTGGVTYANLKEFRRALYSETLGPYLALLEQKLTRRLQHIIEGGRVSGAYLEFNLKQKLAGSFEEEAAVLHQAIGGPHMSINEGRKRQNLPSIGPVGDVVMRPLNMTNGDPDGQPQGMSADELLKRVNVAKGLIQYGFTPQAALAAAGLDPIEHLGLLPTTLQSVEKVEAEGDPVKGNMHRVEIKGAQPAEEGNRTLDLVRGVLDQHAARQRAAVLSRLGGKSAQWWDGKRWDEELAADLTRVALQVTEQLGVDVARQLGAPEAYDTEVTVPFLLRVAESRAGMINATTYEQLLKVLDDADGDPAAVFDDLQGARGEQSAVTLHNTLAAFAGVEAAKHVGRAIGASRTTKTWVVRSGNPRAAHSKMNGQTVGIDEKFSNGAEWPGDPVLGADGVAGCMCSVEVEVETNE